MRSKQTIIAQTDCIKNRICLIHVASDDFKKPTIRQTLAPRRGLKGIALNVHAIKKNRHSLCLMTSICDVM